jgi:uncharacterized protein (DUF1919 family)
MNIRNISFELLRSKTKKLYRNSTAPLRSRTIKNKEFTIISNNCWGGFIYQSYGIQYQTPTIGLSIPASDYLRFLSNIEHYLDYQISEIPFQESKYASKLSGIPNWGKFPIGLLGDVELFLIHYKYINEARLAWERRKKRILWNHLLVKFNDQNLASDEDLLAFEKLPFENKICFVGRKIIGINELITHYIPNSSKNGCIQTSYEPFGNSRIININDIINGISE